MCFLLHAAYTCKLLVFLTCAACTHVFCYSAAYMLLTHMQATSISHMCGLHTCVLLCTVQAIYAAALCSWVADLVLSSFILSSYRVSLGQLGRDSLKEIKRNSWGIQKNWNCPKCAAHKYMRYAACMHAYCSYATYMQLLVSNCKQLQATAYMLHIIVAHIVHTLLRCVQTSSAVCGTSVTWVQLLLYAPCMQNECVCVQHKCSM